MQKMLVKSVIAGLLFAVAEFVSAATFTLRDVQGIYNGRLSYGTLYRLQGRDKDQIAIASDGNALTANTDDGNLNYDKGLVSSTVRATGEVALSPGGPPFWCPDRNLTSRRRRSNGATKA